MPGTSPPPQLPGRTAPDIDVTLPDDPAIEVTVRRRLAEQLPAPGAEGQGEDAGQEEARAEASPPWEAWAPPLNPPAQDGLPLEVALALASAWWDQDPHLCAALQWEAYAATLPPTPTVAQVATGSQSVSYSPPVPGGEYGLAVSRADWHRGLAGQLHSAPLTARGS